MDFITMLNDFAGLFALLALIATIVVPIVLYRKQKKDERQAAQDEYDALMNSLRFPMTTEQRDFNIKKAILQKRMKKNG